MGFKQTKKFIDLSTGTNGVNGQSIIANHSATNYTPVQEASEGIDKISAHLKGIDNSLGTIANPSDIVETSFSLSNNQSSAANVTGFSFGAGVRSFKALVSVSIDATVDLFEVIEIMGINKGGTWNLVGPSRGGDDSLVNFDITAGGQVQYTSGNYSGFTSGTIKFRAQTTTV